MTPKQQRLNNLKKSQFIMKLGDMDLDYFTYQWLLYQSH